MKGRGSHPDFRRASQRPSSASSPAESPTKAPPKNPRARRNHGLAGLLLALAEVFGDFAEVQEQCNSFQVVWKFLVDLLVYESPKIHGDDPVCLKGLYSIPARVVDQIQLWETMDEGLILEKTYEHLEEDRVIEFACLGRNEFFDPSRYYHYYDCVANKVGVIYGKLTLAIDILHHQRHAKDQPWIQGQVKKILDNHLAANVNCRHYQSQKLVATYRDP